MKNSLFRKILAVGATLALVSSFFVAVPVSAAPKANDWGEISMPVLAPKTEVSVMDVAPDGTIFLAVYYEVGATVPAGLSAQHWYVYYSTDGGFTWSKTNMPGIKDTDPNEQGDVTGPTPVKIKVSPMWPSNKNVYVAFSNGDIWRLPEGGQGTPKKLEGIVDKQSQILGVEELGDRDTCLWDMDIWSDGTYNYLAVATDLDVFMFKDELGQNWKDYELNVKPIDEESRVAREVRFAPDFATSELLWAVVAGDGIAHNDCPKVDGKLESGWLYLVSADSPARWGFTFDPVDFTPYANGKAENTRFVDLAFDPDYTSQSPMIYVAIASDKWNALGDGTGDPKKGNLYFVNGEAKAIGPGPMESGYIFFEDQALGTVQVSGNTIMVQNAWTGEVYTTTDRGNIWEPAKRSPAGKAFGSLLMSPNYETDKTVYSTVADGKWWPTVNFGISGVYRSTDGGVFFDGISWLDMTIDSIVDLAFDPKGGSQPVLMVVKGDANAYFIFYTADATAKSPRWLMKDNAGIYKIGIDELDEITMISWDEAGSVVMFMGKVTASPNSFSIFRSTDEGNSFTKWRDLPVGTIGDPVDWYVVDASTVSTVGETGYWGVKPFGLPFTKLTSINEGNSVARQGDKIAVGTTAGTAYVSTDAGNTWSAAVTVGAGDVYVAYGPDGALYAASDNVYKVTPGTTAGAYTPDELVDSLDNDVDNSDGYNGIWVSPDNTLYAKDADGMVRLLLGETGNRWQYRGRDGEGLWGTTGSNLLWTVDDDAIWALEDFNSGAVQGITVEEIDKDPSSAVKSIKVTWDAFPATARYAIYVNGSFEDFWSSADTDDWDATGNPDAGIRLSKVITVAHNTAYDVQVRAAARGALQSRLSAKASITTDCLILAPTPRVPVQGMQDASIAPSFVWEVPADGCTPVKYDFQLSLDPNFGSFIIDTTVTGTGYTYTARDLAYDTNHYWRVRSVAADGTKSAWTAMQNFHTMLEPVEPTQAPDITLTVTQNPAPVVTVSIPPAQTVTVPPAVTLTQTVTSVPTPTLVMPEQPTPAYIWVIVAVGAVLTIAVIVLIIRTRRAE